MHPSGTKALASLTHGLLRTYPCFPAPYLLGLTPRETPPFQQTLPFATWALVITDGWLKFTWQDLHSVNLSLRSPLPTIPPAWARDIFLMESFVAQGATPSQLRLLNEVHMYKHVTCLSKLTTVDCLYIEQAYLTASSPTCPSQYEWPRTTRPTHTNLQLWKHFILDCFLPPHSFSYHLVHPLGPLQQYSSRR